MNQRNVCFEQRNGGTHEGQEKQITSVIARASNASDCREKWWESELHAL